MNDLRNARSVIDEMYQHLVVRKGNYDTTYYDYYSPVGDEINREAVTEIVADYAVAKMQGASNHNKILVINDGGNVIPGEAQDVYNTDPAVRYVETTTLYVGENQLSASSPVTLGTGWTGNITSGFTHASGNTDALVFTAGTDVDGKYIVEFDATGMGYSNLYVSIGDEPSVDIYNGTSHFVIGIVSDGGNLTFTPVSNYVGTISNLTLKKVGDTGTPLIQTVKNVNHGNDVANLTGFWNVAIGSSNTQNSNQNGSRNIAIGYASQNRLKYGTRNIAVGTFPYLSFV